MTTQTTRVRLPDGSFVNVPTSDPKAAAAAARRHWENRQSTEGGLWNRYKKWTDEVASPLVDTVVDTVVPNWGDELRGAGRAVRAVVSGRDPGAAFREGQWSFRADQNRIARTHPKSRAAAVGTGVALSVALPAGQAVKGGALSTKVLQGAGVGAGYGILSGAGMGEGGGRVSNAIQQGTTGAAFGALTSPVLTVAGRLGRSARSNIPAVDRAVTSVARRLPGAAPRALSKPAATAQAERMAGAELRRGNISHGPGQPGPAASPVTVAQEVARRQSHGVPAMVADTTPHLREVTGWASRGAGPGQTMVRERLAERKAQEANRVRGHVSANLPTTADPIAFIEDATRQARAAVAPHYDAAYGQPMYRTPPIQAVEQTPAFRGALPQAYDNIRNQIDPATGLPKDPQAMGFRYFDGEPGTLPPNTPHFALPERGYVSVDSGLSTEGYDQVARQMSDSGRAAAIVNPVTGRVENTTNSVHINARAAELRQLLRDQNPHYDQAVGRYGDDTAVIGAFQRGQDVGKLSAHEINAQRRATPELAQSAWAAGAGTSLADEASRYGSAFENGDTANHIRKLVGDDAKQAAISEMTGNTGGVRELGERLELERQGNMTWRAVNGNSATQPRKAFDDDLDAQLGSPLSGPGAMRSLVDFVASRVQPQFRNAVKERVGQIVTASDAQSVRDVMRSIEETAQGDQAFADLLHKGGIAATAAYAGQRQGPQPDDEQTYMDGY